ncbi:LacI family DNA-binding transcriptional regulator [Paenibacillus hamazuiensis]|uniref:LacI family DNA-binding transcriptional regulator n=1 Tax=Paenibacillus hamazuiensis TaxID=2936508 RepID=UPI00200CE947|nr:LacI family DNA-binding transcriptional regulator [Paenibacillus hamazuiensis]
MVTIKDIAKQLGVSVSTVSRALNNHPDIKPETKREVLEAMEKFQYTPNALARSLINKKSYTVGLMIPDIKDPFFANIADGVEEVLSDSGYQVVYGNTTHRLEKEIRFLGSVIERKMDGIIATPDVMNDEIVDLLKRLEIPVVLTRRRPPEGLDIPVVDVDHYKGACTAVEYLLSLKHRHIGFIGMPEYSFTGQERYRGYVDTLQAGGIRPDPNGAVFGGRTIEDGYKAMARLREQFPSVSAVFAANDMLGIGALEWLAKHGVKVPEQVSVIGFDNVEVSDLHWIKLTTIAQPRNLMGRKAAELLLAMMQGNPVPAEPIFLDTELIVRNTCAEYRPG